MINSITSNVINIVGYIATALYNTVQNLILFFTNAGYFKFIIKEHGGMFLLIILITFAVTKKVQKTI